MMWTLGLTKLTVTRVAIISNICNKISYIPKCRKIKVIMGQENKLNHYSK